MAITRGGFVSKAERKVLNDQLAEARSQRDTARARTAQLEQQEEGAREYVDDTYPALVAARLTDIKVVLVSVGPMDSGTLSDVLGALRDAGAPSPLRVREIKVPIDDRSLSHALAGRAALAQYRGGTKVQDLGHALALELVLGGKTPLWDALSSQLVEHQLGGGRAAADAVVVARSAKPQHRGTARFIAGFYSGLAGAGPPAVGVEDSSQTPSPIGAFERASLSTVDSIDTEPGKLALVLLLAGGEPGHYGSQATARDGLLPTVEPLSPSGG